MLEEALASVISQDFAGVVEIIVVDDNSQDGTSEIVKRYTNVHLISLKQNVGVYAARNRALLVAKGKYIAFLDSDDLWETNYLKTQIAALAGKERCFCASALVAWDTVTDQKKIRLQKPNLVKFTSLIHQLLCEGSFIITLSSVVFPQQVFDEIGLFDETYRVGGDNDLYTRCLLAGYQLIFTELPLVIYRKHDKGKLTDPKNLELRKKGRIERLNKYPLIEKCVGKGSRRRIRAEIHASFASQYFKTKHFLRWLISSLESAYNASPVYALSNMKNDITEGAIWSRFWLQFAGLGYFGRSATYLATWFVPPDKERRHLASYNSKGYIAPSATIHHPNLKIGANVFIGERVAIQANNSGSVELGNRVRLHNDICIETGDGGSLKIGSDTYIQPRCQFSVYKAPIQIGCRVRIAANCAFYPYDHGLALGEVIRKQPLQTKGGITIDDDARLGLGVIVLDGVRIGKGAVVGAGAVVTHDVPDGAKITVEVPARVVNMRSSLAGGREVDPACWSEMQ
jgi:acetyltransferase-like isoleucine patch superfamily enzyme/GT2 family glycosyltransferase